MGLILDLQVIRPDPQVELDGRVVAELDGERLFRWADAATAAIDARVRDGDLVEEAVDDHDVCKHYANGAELVEDVAGSKRRLPDAVVPRIAAIEEPVLTRERCRLRRLRVGGLARPREPDSAHPPFSTWPREDDGCLRNRTTSRQPLAGAPHARRAVDRHTDRGSGRRPAAARLVERRELAGALARDRVHRGRAVAGDAARHPGDGASQATVGSRASAAPALARRARGAARAPPHAALVPRAPRR